MKWAEWQGNQGTMPLERMFEYTAPDIAAQFSPIDQTTLQLLIALPCVFMQEGSANEIARVGTVFRAAVQGREISFEFVLDPAIPALTNEIMWQNRADFEMPHDFEFSRTHWAVKRVDLYRAILRHHKPQRRLPSVFTLQPYERIEPTLVSVMMSFDAAFDPVYRAIQQTMTAQRLACRRADEIWDAPAVIQDVVNLIDKSRIVVCDCTNRNPNVFYEAGIAHTLGRDVILLSQNEEDIPFDLRHLRYIRYLNNGEGLTALQVALTNKVARILGQD